MRRSVPFLFDSQTKACSRDVQEMLFEGFHDQAIP